MRWHRAEALIAATATAMVLVVVAAGAQDDEVSGLKLEEVEQELDRAKARQGELEERIGALSSELGGLREALLETLGSMREKEAQIDATRSRLDELNGELARREAAFETRRGELASVLGALQRLSRKPADMLIALPGSPTDSHRTAMLLASITPYLDEQATAIRREIEEIETLRTEIAAEERRLENARAGLEADRQRTANLIATKETLLEESQEERETLEQKSARLAEEARTLRELLARLAEDAAETGQAGDPGEVAAAGTVADQHFSEAQGNLPLPAGGHIVIRFGDTGNDGATSEGLVIETRPGAEVVTPYDGRIVFSGTFRDYGPMLIIAHGEGYHTVLAGFERAYGSLGQWLLAGEPVGVMTSGGDVAGRLYIELRRDGEPINPLPWLAARDNQASG